MKKVRFKSNSDFIMELFAGTLTFENGVMWEHEKVDFKGTIRN